jgi:predicted DNA-binding transcriptional regulator YafY
MSTTLLRYMEMLKLLSRDRKLSASEIQRRLEDKGYKASKRTIERDLQMLSIPFGLEADERNKPYGWRYASNVSISLVPGLSETEALSFLLLKQFSSRLLPASLKDDLAPYFREAQRKLSDDVSSGAVKTWPKKVRCVDPHQPLLAPAIDPVVQKEVHAALLRGKQISIIYRPGHRNDAKEYSPINVLGLVEHGAIVYLIATFFNYEDIRIIAMHRIRKATMLDSASKVPVGFDLDGYIKSGAFGFGAIGQTIDIELHFYNNAGAHLLETRLAENQVTEELEDGVLSVKATVMDTPRLRWWILGFGPDVEVISPDRLRRDIQTRLEDAASRYGKRSEAPHANRKSRSAA